MARNLIPTMPIHPNGYDRHIANTEIREASDSSAYGERIAQCVSHHLGEFNGTPIDRNLSSRVKKVLDVILDDFSAKDLPGESGWFTTKVASEVPPTPVGGPLMFTSSGSTTLTLYRDADDEEDDPSSYVPNLQVSSDGTNWTTIEKDSPYTFSGSIYVSGNNPNGWFFYDSEIDAPVYFSIDMRGDNVCISGSIMSLIDPALQTTEIPCDECFSCLFNPSMDEDLDSLPEIDASELVLAAPSTEYCYGNLFSRTNIVNPPLLPFTTLSTHCYANMFSECTSLTSAPVLPATILAEGCYSYMFTDCDSLTSAPTLPATTLASKCYSGMFCGCDSLASAPTLPATILAEECYSYMFADCGSLASTPTLPATILTSGCYAHMFEGCASLTLAPTLPVTTLADWCYSYMFSNCTSLTSAPVLPATELTEGCYSDMFYNCTSLASAPTLPATTLASECYSYMFSNCTSLTSAPSLPVTELAEGCYTGMFSACTSLTSAPVLPATTLTVGCYSYMFSECTSLTSAPVLPATELEFGCYANMFSECTSLTSAPVLPAIELVEECYMEMFLGCTSLDYINCAATDISADYCIDGWVEDVSDSGDFYGKTAAGWSDGESGIPSGWTKHLS